MSKDTQTAVDADPGPVGLGGWLILVGIGVCIAPIRLFMELRFYPELFTDGTFEVITDLNLESYHPLWGPLIIGELAFNLVMLVATLVLIGLYFTRHHWFPRLYIIVLLSFLLFIPLDIWVTTLVLPDMPVWDKETADQMMRTVVSCAIWVPYMLRSRRVKNTFVRGRSQQGAPAAVSEQEPVSG
ncbi:DUF2569 domain-containing protein [Ferrimonas balearica]|uniref:DUF2569 domain-containing protein n=1 Tax=Ferrimonas balearica TaxID=44012 RepID=UPI001C996D1D|nr:DUF2569 domain-containing protein [Ferrimonas balearica]MBY5920206.1 DUF2569 domain-containing protein [Ferrimonas balearica]MBY5997109.1 DUF2569 domain-containing protein [Ferrimonas balearica]